MAQIHKVTRRDWLVSCLLPLAAIPLASCGGEKDPDLIPGSGKTLAKMYNGNAKIVILAVDGHDVPAPHHTISDSFRYWKEKGFHDVSFEFPKEWEDLISRRIEVNRYGGGSFTPDERNIYAMGQNALDQSQRIHGDDDAKLVELSDEPDEEMNRQLEIDLTFSNFIKQLPLKQEREDQISIDRNRIAARNIAALSREEGVQNVLKIMGSEHTNVNLKFAKNNISLEGFLQGEGFPPGMIQTIALVGGYAIDTSGR